MRILSLSTTFPRNPTDGSGRFVLNLARSLAEQDQVEVLAPNFPGGKQVEEFGGVKVHRFNYFYPTASQCVLYPDGIPDQLRRSHLARLQAPFFVLRFMHEIIRHRRHADVLLCNWIFTAMLAQWCQPFRRMPMAVVVRGSDMKLVETRGILGRLFERTLQRADAICVVASEFKTMLEARGVERVFVTPNGIDYPTRPKNKLAARRKLGLDEGTPFVMFAGSLIERKGLAYLIDAMAGIDAELIVVGQGSLAAQLQQQAREGNVRARFVGQVAYGDMSTWYEAADIFVLPSLYEGRPNVLIEALARGLPCIATCITGTRELIADNDSGLLVEPRDVVSLQAHIKQVLNDQTLSTHLSAHAAQHLRTVVPSWQTCAENYRSILRPLVRRTHDDPTQE